MRQPPVSERMCVGNAELKGDHVQVRDRRRGSQYDCKLEPAILPRRQRGDRGPHHSMGDDRRHDCLAPGLSRAARSTRFASSGAPRRLQRFFRLEDDGEFGQVESPDMHQRACARLGGYLGGVRKSIPHLP